MTTLAPKSPSPLHKAVARHALEIFGGDPVVHAYHHDEIEDLSVDMLEVDDSPDEGLISYSTLGVFAAELVHDDGGPMETRVELCSEMPDDVELWGNVMATAAFTLIRGGHAVIPGSVLAHCVAEYYAETTVPHLYLCVPYSWEDGNFPRLEIDGVVVNWLQAVPISDAERVFIEVSGHEKFEDELLKREPDIYDLERSSIC